MTDNNPRINITKEDHEEWLTNQFINMIIEKKHPNVIKKARKLAKKFLKEQEVE